MNTAAFGTDILILGTEIGLSSMQEKENGEHLCRKNRKAILID